MNSNEDNLMSVKSRFCKVLSQVKEKEMLAFIEAVDIFEYSKAAESLESLAAMQELTMDICPRT